MDHQRELELTIRTASDMSSPDLRRKVGQVSLIHPLYCCVETRELIPVVLPALRGRLSWSGSQPRNKNPDSRL